jgi:hypothetical protein
MMVVHDFKTSLAKSHAQTDAPWWREVYEQAFPGLVSMTCVRGDGWAQRGGIDRVLTLGSGKTHTVDEKVRDKAWPDILLEIWSDEKRRKRGWIQKELACDYIAYAFIPIATCYLLPFPTLRRAWRANGQDWIARFPRIEAKNTGYVTVSVAVPIGDLLNAMNDAMTVYWSREAA